MTGKRETTRENNMRKQVGWWMRRREGVKFMRSKFFFKYSYQLDIEENVERPARIQTFNYEKLLVHNPIPTND